MSYVPLDIHSECSFLKAYGTAGQIIARVTEAGLPAFGVADLASTWGHIAFQQAAKRAGIKLLLGVQMPIVRELTKDPRYSLVTLIAKDPDGLKAQYEALTLATKQFFYRPRITWDQLADLPGNFVILNRISPDERGDFKRVRGAFVGAAPSPGLLLSIARSGDFPTVACASPLYPGPADREAYALAVSIGSARRVAEIDIPDQWIMRRGELVARFEENRITRAVADKWMDETLAVADACDAAIPMAINLKPGLEITIEEWCRTGAIERGIDLGADPYKSRYEYEMRLIHEKGFVDYFLLIGDLIAYSKQHMLVGPARGSSAGSLVCYLMGIVEVDPIVHKLLFERFVDVTRVDLPDVDIDFPDDKREIAFDYLFEKYGRHRVARLGTILQFKAKSALNDVGKSYGIPKWEVSGLNELLIERSGGDARANMTVLDTLDQFDAAKALVEKYPKLKMAATLEGHARGTGQHAAGIVISNDDISRYAAIDYYKGGVAELTKYQAEAIGLMKIDALGLRTLSVIQDACDMAGIDPKIMYRLPLDDKKVFVLFGKDQVAGIFQFEGHAVRSLLRQMGVERFDDIVALTSLARPGPLHCGGANEFILRRTAQQDWEHKHPLMVPHTHRTYGVIVYQEQVMSITRDLGDMDWQDVNALRRAMSKSLGEEFFNKFKTKFLDGTRKHDIPDSTAIDIWENMCSFGSWAFSENHAVSYALISYWCAWLKTYHPLQFAVAQLKRSASDDHSFRMLRELVKEGYTIVPFDPERSALNWSADKDKIYGGFLGVKGIGGKTATKFVDERAAGGDWLGRLSPAQRMKLLAPNNTAWHNLTRLHKAYPGLYTDPDSFRPPAIPGGVRGPVLNIEDIPEKAGEYCFAATLKVRNLRDLNETQSLVKRGGKVINTNNLFLNLQMEDDTGAILCAVNRWRYEDLGKPLMEKKSDGEDFLVRGKILEDGRRKINIERIIQISPERV